MSNSNLTRQHNLTVWLDRTSRAADWNKHYLDGKRAIIHHCEFPRWSIKGFICWINPEGRAFQCDIYYDDVKVGDANQAGWGGTDQIRIYGSMESQQSWHELCDACSKAGWGFKQVDSAVLDMILVGCGKLT